MWISFSIQKDFIYVPILIIINTIYDISSNELKLKEEFNLLLIFFSKMILIIFYFIERYLSRKENRNIEKKSVVKLLNEEENTIINPHILITLLISLFFSNVSYYHLKIFNAKTDEINDCIIIIVYLFVLDSLFFEKEIYSHQILSILMIIIGSIFYCIQAKFDYKFLYTIFHLLKCYCIAFNRLLLRYISIKYFINIFFIAYLLGLNGILYLLIRMLIEPNFIDIPDFNKNIHFLFLFFISLIINYFIYYKIIYKLGPILAFISDLIALVISHIILQIQTNHQVISFNHLMLVIIYIISMLIYFEIIQLNFCNLNKNTKKKVYERAIDDTNYIILNSDNESIDDCE